MVDFPRPVGPLSADQIAAESRDVYHLLRRARAGRTLMSLYERFARCTFHVCPQRAPRRTR